MLGDAESVGVREIARGAFGIDHELAEEARVGAEFAAGAAGRETGLASRILEAGFRTDIPRMYAALVLVALTGVAIHLLFNLLARRLLGRWHAAEREPHP